MRMTIAKQHCSIDIRGMLKFYRRKSMAGLFNTDDGRKATDKEVRDFLQEHLNEGHTCIPFGDPSECPDFDYFGGGCPGHGIHYFDNEDNEITKEQYDAAIAKMSNENYEKD